MATMYDFEGNLFAPTKRGFTGCCGAGVLVGMSPDLEPGEWSPKRPFKFTVPGLHQFTLGITNPTQEKEKCVLEGLDAAGMQRLGTFMGAHGYELTLWGGGPKGFEFKPNPGLYAPGDEKKSLDAYKKEVEKLRGILERTEKDYQELADREPVFAKEVMELKRKLAMQAKKLVSPKIRLTKTVGRTRLTKVRRGE